MPRTIPRRTEIAHGFSSGDAWDRPLYDIPRDFAREGRFHTHHARAARDLRALRGSSQRSANARRTPRAANAVANVRRIQVKTRGREMTWFRSAAANLP